MYSHRWREIIYYNYFFEVLFGICNLPIRPVRMIEKKPYIFQNNTIKVLNYEWCRSCYSLLMWTCFPAPAAFCCLRAAGRLYLRVLLQYFKFDHVYHIIKNTIPWHNLELHKRLYNTRITTTLVVFHIVRYNICFTSTLI